MTDSFIIGWCDDYLYWDAENRLKATEGGGTSTVYDYDYSGICVSQKVIKNKAIAKSLIIKPIKLYR
ncbi:hypothetical protein [Pseudanabaena sp. 'Roaring Creek']|uniref:hypothetical protein n=1 Tax=Pseudanabaena sp. 'Roaring Creek' TaxID=1681830 RepID=UPI000B014CD9|nr:hypothetical protein [Pseudanabaena sp. 'Roaring Creek']